MSLFDTIAKVAGTVLWPWEHIGAAMDAIGQTVWPGRPPPVPGIKVPYPTTRPQIPIEFKYASLPEDIRALTMRGFHMGRPVARLWEFEGPRPQLTHAFAPGGYLRGNPSGSVASPEDPFVAVELLAPSTAVVGRRRSDGAKVPTGRGLDRYTGADEPPEAHVSLEWEPPTPTVNNTARLYRVEANATMDVEYAIGEEDRVAKELLILKRDAAARGVTSQYLGRTLPVRRPARPRVADPSSTLGERFRDPSPLSDFPLESPKGEQEWRAFWHYYAERGRANLYYAVSADYDFPPPKYRIRPLDLLHPSRPRAVQLSYSIVRNPQTVFLSADPRSTLPAMWTIARSFYVGMIHSPLSLGYFLPLNATREKYTRVLWELARIHPFGGEIEPIIAAAPPAGPSAAPPAPR